MDLLDLILFIVIANTLPLSGISKNQQFFLLTTISFYLGFDLQHDVIWIDGTLYTSSTICGQTGILFTNTYTLDGAPLVLDQSTQLSSCKRFISINKIEGILRVHLDFLHMSVEDVRVFVDGYQAEWNTSTRSFEIDFGNDDTPRTSNTSTSEEEFNGVTFSISTNGVPLKHLKYM
jgi:hypothetical protein